MYPFMTIDNDTEVVLQKYKQMDVLRFILKPRMKMMDFITQCVGFRNINGKI